VAARKTPAAIIVSTDGAGYRLTKIRETTMPARQETKMGICPINCCKTLSR
jgi:hypothetical protein